MGNNPSMFKWSDELPVEQVSWDDAQEFLKRLRNKTGDQTWRLPSEAEWEYAARAGSTGKYIFGDSENELGNHAWFSNNSSSQTHPVGQKQANQFGLYDMHGNVWEWCADWYGENYYSQSPTTDPRGPGSGSLRVFLGGDWPASAAHCRSAFRLHNSPGHRIRRLGFRLPRTPG